MSNMKIDYGIHDTLQTHSRSPYGSPFPADDNRPSFQEAEPLAHHDVSLVPPIHLMSVRPGSSPLVLTPIVPCRAAVGELQYVRAGISATVEILVPMALAAVATV